MSITDTVTIAGKTFRSRLFVGTGKYSSFPLMAQALEASGAEVVTVAVRRVNISDRSKGSLLDHIDPKKYFLLPNTAGCYTADDAIRTARLGREAGLSNWVKLEVIGDERTLFPDNEALLEATRVLVEEGFVVLPYTSDDRIVRRVGKDGKTFFHEDARGFDGGGDIGVERLLVADDLDLDPVAQADLASEARGSDGVVGGVAAGGVRQQEVLFGVDEIEQRFLRAVEVHATNGDGDHFGSGGREGLTSLFSRLVLSGTDDEAR